MRIEHWQAAFWSLMDENARKPFAWGSHDCATFSWKVIETVSDRRIDLSATWDSEETAARWIGERGGLQAIVTSYLGEPTNWGACSMADIVLTEMPNGEALAVHDGTQLIAPGLHGLRRIPFEFARIGWRI